MPISPCQMDHELSTPPQDGSNNVDVGSSRKRKRRANQSYVWDHFSVDPVSTDRARCNYCNISLKCNNGTTSMRNHSNKCKSNPNSSSSTVNVCSSPSTLKFDQEKCREALVKMFVAMELPFRAVEHEAFLEFLHVLLIVAWFCYSNGPCGFAVEFCYVGQGNHCWWCHLSRSRVIDQQSSREWMNSLIVAQFIMFACP